VDQEVVDRKNERAAGFVKRAIAFVLLWLMLGVALVATIELVLALTGFAVNARLENQSFSLIQDHELLKVLALFLDVLIVLELADTIQLYIKEHRVNTELVLLVALVALARKVIILELGAYEPLALIGLASLIIASAGAYFLLRRTDRMGGARPAG